MLAKEIQLHVYCKLYYETKGIFNVALSASSFEEIETISLASLHEILVLESRNLLQAPVNTFFYLCFCFFLYVSFHLKRHH